MHNNEYGNEFFEKDRMSENVDKLMNDMTEFTANRRERDAEMLSIIRDKQNSAAPEKKSGNSILDKFKGGFSRKKNKKSSDVISYANASPISQAMPVSVNYNYDYDDETALDEDKTVLMDEFDDGDATVLMDMDDGGTDLMVVLKIGDDELRRILPDGRLTFGSLADRSDIVLNSRHVSRCHAELICRGGELYIIDLGSKNGTYINGNKIRLQVNTEYKINPGDSVTMADTEILIHEYRGSV